jgi:LysM repeat protein
VSVEIEAEGVLQMTATVQPPEQNKKSSRNKGLWRSKRMLFATSIATGALIIGATATLAAGFLSHRVQFGDTLSELAETYGTTVNELVALNQINNPDLIVINDELIIRDLQDGDDPAAAVHTHVVIPGDTLTSIAAALGLTVEDLAAANGLENLDLIVTGDLLRIPSGSSSNVIDAVDGRKVVDGVEIETTESAGNDEVAAPIRVSNEIQPQTPTTPVQAGSSTMHLVLPGDTVASIAETYEVSTSQLLAANGHARNGISVGMILKVPPSDSENVQLVGMPTAIESSPVGSELTAVSVATAYWGSTISEAVLYEALDLSDNPHFGFRGDVNGVYGGTDDYGVYAGPLAEVIASRGFVGEAFYAAGDANELTNRIDRGLPVVAWITYGTAVATPERIDDGLRPFTVVPGKQAVVVYGYDADGVLIADIAHGGYAHVNWTDFMRSWNYFDGMGLAISPI